MSLKKQKKIKKLKRKGLESQYPLYMDQKHIVTKIYFCHIPSKFVRSIMPQPLQKQILTYIHKYIHTKNIQKFKATCQEKPFKKKRRTLLLGFLTAYIPCFKREKHHKIKPNFSIQNKTKQDTEKYH